MNTKFAFILGATMLLSACDRHPDTVVVSPQPQPQQYVEQQQPIYVQQPNTVVVQQDTSGQVMNGVATGMIMGHLLSHSYGDSGYYHSHTYAPQHTTIVHNTYINKSVTSTPYSAPKATTPRSFSSKGFSSGRVSVSRSYQAKSVHVSPFARH